MLATEMVATHEAMMECMRRAMIRDQSFEGWDQNLKHAEKLLAIFARQIEVLDKHRGKGQQKVTVEHVHVEAGGQAIVGHVEAGASGVPPTNKGASKPEAITENAPDTIEMEIGSKKPKRRRQTSKRINGVKSQT